MTEGPDPILIRRLSWIEMVPPEYAKDREIFMVSPVGTGPYKFVEWVKGQRVVLTANEDYWGEMPTIKDVTYRFIAEPATRLAALKAGEVNIYTNPPPEFVNEVPKLETIEGINFMWMRLNPFRPPLDDIRVRQAIVHAIDSEAIVDTVYEGLATVPQGQMVTPFHTGFNPDLKPYSYDPDKAKELLADYGQPVSIDLVIESSGYFPKGKELGEATASYLRDAGIDVETRYLEFSPWLDELMIQPDEDPKQHPYLIISRHQNATFDSDRTITAIFHSGKVQSTYSDADLDEMIDQARVELDEMKRQALYNEAWKFIHDQAWCVPFLNYDELYGLGENVEWTPRLDQRIMLSEIRLTE
jgi:peptide/nickel transport system substrate-binding protein